MENKTIMEHQVAVGVTSSGPEARQERQERIFEKYNGKKFYKIDE